jgi:hypothetical protein
MILSTQELRLIARDMLRLLPERAAIQRASEVTDQYGVVYHVYTTVATDIPCRVAPVTTGYGPAREQVQLRGDVILALPREVELRVGDLVTVGAQHYRVVETSELGMLGFLRRVGAEVMQ